MNVQDHMWLDPAVLRPLTRTDVYALDLRGGEDRRSIRLRGEILELTGGRLASGVGDDGGVRPNVVLAAGGCGLADDDAFRMSRADGVLRIEGNTSLALLYGFYAYLRDLVLGRVVREGDGRTESPSHPMRMIDHWDQIDGTVERGYGGASIFFGIPGENDNGSYEHERPWNHADPFRNDLGRLTWYARLLASVGVNGIVLNNVNVRGGARRLIVEPYLDKVAELADLFDGFGIAVYLSVHFAAPISVGGLSSADPCDPDVRAWWMHTAKAIYERIPQFGGFLVKADSEGEPGPHEYGRTQADGANMLAEALRPYGGRVVWRAFVYDCHLDWRDRTRDRAVGAYETFQPLDGAFADNVCLQIKFGPVDFQTCEPANPLLHSLRATNIVVEFQIAAEYLGHQIDVNFAPAQWIDVMGQPVDGGSDGVPLSRSLRARALDPANVGYAGVANVGMGAHWTGGVFAQASLYGFGRMCWDAGLSAEHIADEWAALTFPGAGRNAQGKIAAILKSSNRTYRDYTAPLGVGWMFAREDHYGPSVCAFEYDRWGGVNRADRDGVGVDRTSTGSGLTEQYPSALRDLYADPARCPDELLLFFHWVPYGHVLHGGKTVVQHIYDTHFAGVERVREYVAAWDGLRGVIDGPRFENVAERLRMQLDNAVAWRDQINTFFHRMSGVPDERGREIYP
ncbi:alpha-glucuronidase [Bifidobacterium avesanii]|uniref:Alpha-glucuronidase n=1 Tax=Bifidobacterium avesanii TaxID=1798157 RepID=A0A7K3TIW8_9BIFI|nr:alpha-glucuronidase [Bifidobacterium avesanii]KAB8291931.1 alpha-glucuronidase [Bifidobacterium avesanii]NEG79032.1 alpha-glucuronidase [Bifidobacterium avesanii]